MFSASSITRGISWFPVSHFLYDFLKCDSTLLLLYVDILALISRQRSAQILYSVNEFRVRNHINRSECYSCLHKLSELGLIVLLKRSGMEFIIQLGDPAGYPTRDRCYPPQDRCYPPQDRGCPPQDNPYPSQDTLPRSSSIPPRISSPRNIRANLDINNRGNDAVDVDLSFQQEIVETFQMHIPLGSTVVIGLRRQSTLSIKDFYMRLAQWMHGHQSGSLGKIRNPAGHLFTCLTNLEFDLSPIARRMESSSPPPDPAPLPDPSLTASFDNYIKFLDDAILKHYAALSTADSSALLERLQCECRVLIPSGRGKLWSIALRQATQRFIGLPAFSDWQASQCVL